MAKVGAQRAAELTSKSKSTIQRAMNSGKLSYELDNNGRRVIDVSELDRVFGLQQATANAAPVAAAVEVELEKANNMIEIERMKMRIRMLEAQLETAEDQVDDLKAQRDSWQRQATQVLLTSQYSQKQAEELADQLKAREERERLRREQYEKKKLEARMREMAKQNANDANSANAQTQIEKSSAADPHIAQNDQGTGFGGLFKRLKRA